MRATQILFSPASSQTIKDQLADLLRSNGSSEAVWEITAAKCTPLYTNAEHMCRTSAEGTCIAIEKHFEYTHFHLSGQPAIAIQTRPRTWSVGLQVLQLAFTQIYTRLYTRSIAYGKKWSWMAHTAQIWACSMLDAWKVSLNEPPPFPFCNGSHNNIFVSLTRLPMSDVLMLHQFRIKPRNKLHQYTLSDS